jgi:hypothetical protein
MTDNRELGDLPPINLNYVPANMSPLLFATMYFDIPLDQIQALTNSHTSRPDKSWLVGSNAKVACCMGKDPSQPNRPIGATDEFNIKLPNPDSKITGGLPTENMYKYINKKIRIPSGFCTNNTELKDYNPGSATCNKFMDTYCENVKQDFIKANEGQLEACCVAIIFSSLSMLYIT